MEIYLCKEGLKRDTELYLSLKSAYIKRAISVASNAETWGRPAAVNHIVVDAERGSAISMRRCYNMATCP
jgi:hypothetical protein